MPVIVVNLPPAVFGEIRGFVDKGLHASPEQFLEIAASNLVALERGATPEQVLTGGHRYPVDQIAQKSAQPAPPYDDLDEVMRARKAKAYWNF
jgi:hypothetical protein